MYRASDGFGALVDVLFSEQSAAKTLFRSTRTVTGVTPDLAPPPSAVALLLRTMLSASEASEMSMRGGSTDRMASRLGALRTASAAIGIAAVRATSTTRRARVSADGLYVAVARAASPIKPERLRLQTAIAGPPRNSVKFLTARTATSSGRSRLRGGRRIHGAPMPTTNASFAS